LLTNRSGKHVEKQEKLKLFLTNRKKTGKRGKNLRSKKPR
jgi:hypothetical protein